MTPDLTAQVHHPARCLLQLQLLLHPHQLRSTYTHTHTNGTCLSDYVLVKYIKQKLRFLKLTLNDDVNGTAGVQGGQGGNGHLTHVFSCRFIVGVLQLQCVSTTDLLSILHTHKHNTLHWCCNGVTL